MKYDSTIVLDIDALDICEGRIHILTGPNGSGKSTLLNLLSFLAKPSSGELFYLGNKIDWKTNSTAHLRKEATLLHQIPYLFHGTVFDNVALGLKFRGIRADQCRLKVLECLQTVGLRGFEQRNAKALSGGERQRVALARALVIEPKVLLLDEPFSGVDATTTGLLEALLSDLPNRGTTVIIASHDQIFENTTACGRINLKRGKVS